MSNPTSTHGRKAALALALGGAITMGQPALSELAANLYAISHDGVGAAPPSPLSPVAMAAEPKGESGTKRWTCPMHPHYIAEEFGACPICGMDLVELAGADDAQAPASADARTVVTVSPEIVQNMGVRVAPAEMSSFGRQIRSFGIIRENERLQTEVTARVEGWVENLEVTAVGDAVTQDGLLFELYSPELIVSQHDYLRERRSNAQARNGLSQLRAFGVHPKAIELIKERKEPLERVPFFADRGGTISELRLKEGAYVTRGALLARIQDYSSVWLIVSVAEKDLDFIDRDTPARASFPNQPGRAVAAMVDYIYPTIDQKTRTGQVRLVIDNTDGRIRPGGYADVTFEVDAEQRVAVPSEAILTSERGRYVVASLGEGRFEPREVEVGLVSGRWTEIARGVQPGESIVVSGQFLLDSESALRESFRKLERIQTPLSLLQPDSNDFAMIDHLVDAALYLHETQIDGYDVNPAFLDPAISIRDLLWPRYKDTQLAFVLDDSVAALREAQAARTPSEAQAALAKLSSALKPWVLDGTPDHYRDRGVAMFSEPNAQRLWLQIGERSLNPYGPEAGEALSSSATDEKAASHEAADEASKSATHARRRSGNVN